MDPTSPLTDAQLRARWQALDRGLAGVRKTINHQLRVQIGLPASWTAVLIALAEAPDHRQPTHDVARHTELTSGGFTKLADRLVHAGLITRNHSTTDRRIVFLSLTPLGVQKAAEAARIQLAVLRRELTRAPATDLMTLIEAVPTDR